MKKKNPKKIIFLLFALPFPVAAIGSFMSFLWLFSALMRFSSLVEIIAALFGTIIGTAYFFTYTFALNETRKEQRVTGKTFLPLLHCAVALIFLLLLKPASGYIDNSEKHFGFAKKDFSVVEEFDDHGGFLGDGSYRLILDCSGKKEKALRIIKKWKPLPMTENLNLMMYGGERGGTTYGFELAKEAHMPKIENGYYIFEDRHSESKNSSDDSELFERYSYNFSIAVYDCDTDKMYYFKYDT